MTALNLLDALQNRGVALVADGDRLRFKPRDAVSPSLLIELKQHKAELIELLASDPITHTDRLDAYDQIAERILSAVTRIELSQFVAEYEAAAIPRQQCIPLEVDQ